MITPGMVANKAIRVQPPRMAVGERVWIGGRCFIVTKKYVRMIEGVPFESDRQDGGQWVKMEPARV